MLDKIKRLATRQQTKPKRSGTAATHANLEDPTVKSLVMFLVFVCTMFAVGNYFLCVAALLYSKPWASGAFFTGSSAALTVAVKLVKLLIGR